jgi:hypothetical protein
MVIDGPFAGTKELIAGCTLIRVKSREEALAWPGATPNPRAKGRTPRSKSANCSNSKISGPVRRLNVSAGWGLERRSNRGVLSNALRLPDEVRLSNLDSLKRL